MFENRDGGPFSRFQRFTYTCLLLIRWNKHAGTLLETAGGLHTHKVFLNRASCPFNRATNSDFVKLHRAFPTCIIVRIFYFMPVET